MPQPAIAILDIGKTNKKAVLFNDQYKVLYEESAQLSETIDEDGFPCEDIKALKEWVDNAILNLTSRTDVEVKAINYSAYGASFVHLNSNLSEIGPIYNYLKPYPEKLKQQFYSAYGGEKVLARETASPILGSLNAGLQLYRLKYENPALYENVRCSLHLPQYICFLATKKLTTDKSSVGCHTHLWHFEKQKYHMWVHKENFVAKFAPFFSSDQVFDSYISTSIRSGIGLHDSSAALLPYRFSFREPFVLISTGTWCISLNPFNHSPLTEDELQNDCLCYLSHEGVAVKAARLFAGHRHEELVKRLTSHFGRSDNAYTQVRFDPSILEDRVGIGKNKSGASFGEDLSCYNSFEEGYHHLVHSIIVDQVNSTNLVLSIPVKQIYVDGGFSKNNVYMNLLANAYPEKLVYAAEVPLASAIGAAIAVHQSWNKKTLPSDLISLIKFSKPE